MNLLEISNVTKRFAGLVALNDVSLSVNEKEVVGLIGPNGAGKTTLFSLIAGSLTPTSGNISFNGKKISGLPSNRICKLGVARTFQIPRPFPELTVFENIEVAEMFGHSGISSKKKIGTPSEICEIVGLGKKRKIVAKTLSVSDKKRLEVGRALATRPMLILLDEFAAGLSAQESEWATKFVRQMQNDYGLSIVWIEHVMHVLMKNVDRVFVLDHGVKIAEGPPNEIVKNEKVLEAYFGGKEKWESSSNKKRAEVDEILSVSNLSVYYGETRALWDVNFNVLRSELVAIIGSNGAGKTTTLRSVQGVIKPKSGKIVFLSKDVTEISANKNTSSGMSLIPEGRGLFLRMNVRENLELGAFTKRARKNLNQNLQRMYELFPILKERSTQTAGSLSGGEQQMLAIGRALMSEPQLLMLDEPSLGLAPIMATKVFQTLKELKQSSNLTILLVEQNVNAALGIADRAYLFENGRVVREGTPDKLRDDPVIRQSYLGI